MNIRHLLSAIILIFMTMAYVSDVQAGEELALLPGLTLGAALYHDKLDSPGFFLGGEVSLWRYDIMRPNDGFTPSAMGGYLDGLWDFGADSLRISAGPGLAWLYTGIEGGLLVQRHNGLMGYGISGRLFVSAVVPGASVRVGKTWGDVNDTFIELGLTLKLPLLYK